MKQPVASLSEILRDDRGATTVEYGLLIVLLVLVIFSAVAAVGNPVQQNYESVGNMWPS